MSSPLWHGGGMLGTPTSGRLHRPAASSVPSQPYQVDLQRMFDGVSNGARDRPPLPVKRGGGATEPLGMLVTSAQRMSSLGGASMQLPHRGPAPSGLPCWTTSSPVVGGAAVRSVSPSPDLLPCGVFWPRAPSTLACLPLCAISSSPMCCPSVCVWGVWCGMCAWTDFARVCRSRPVPTCEGPVCHVPAPAAAQDLQLPREQTVEVVTPSRWRRTRLAARSLFRPPLPPPHPLAPWWVCVWFRV